MEEHLPEPFLKRMQRLLDEEYHAFLNSYRSPATTGLRVNTLKVSPEAFLTLAPFHLTPLPWPVPGFLVPNDAQPGRHPYHAAGLYYLQDPSAMTVAYLLAPQPGERVLDLAAAPGGKATHIAALMQNQGVLVCNEIHPRRVWDLAGNLERWGARNVIITNETPERLASQLGEFFDRVLVDAPCSGEGMFRKSNVARREWTPELVRGCALRQSAILNEAARMVRPGGLLVYATCTFAPEENEGVVTRFLRAHPEFELKEPAWAPGFAPGRPDWVDESLPHDPAAHNVTANEEEHAPRSRGWIPELQRTVRLWPHRAPGEGHFVALLRRAETGTVHLHAMWRPRDAPGHARRLYESFCQAHLVEPPATERLALVGSYLYQWPAGAPNLERLRVVHPGWWLGALKKNRFEPSHALALSLTVTDARQVINLAPNSAEVLAYLRGETLRVAGDDGWVIIAVNGYPLGWGKRARGNVKNHYPRGLRWT